MTADDIQQNLLVLGLRFIERGWLSANNSVVVGQDGPSAVVDTGYGAHARQTLELVKHALDGHPLDLIINTHLHSDHCGGNALLSEQHPGASTWIPPGQWEAVEQWDAVRLTYLPTGQECPRFRPDHRLQPGQEIRLGDWHWEIHGAPGHDPHSVVLFQPQHRCLISADALWENGFGVVFPELEGEQAFGEVAETLEQIRALNPAFVIPGHGPIFCDVTSALRRAATRLDQFRGNPAAHLRYAQKVLIKYRLLEWQQISESDLLLWAQATPYLASHMPDPADPSLSLEWLRSLLNELERSGAVRLEGSAVINT